MKTMNQRIMTNDIHPRSTEISDDLRRHLEELVRDDVRDLSLLLSDEFDGWGLI